MSFMAVVSGGVRAVDAVRGGELIEWPCLERFRVAREKWATRRDALGPRRHDARL